MSKRAIFVLELLREKRATGQRSRRLRKNKNGRFIASVDLEILVLDGVFLKKPIIYKIFFGNNADSYHNFNNEVAKIFNENCKYYQEKIKSGWQPVDKRKGA